MIYIILSMIIISGLTALSKYPRNFMEWLGLTCITFIILLLSIVAIALFCYGIGVVFE